MTKTTIDQLLSGAWQTVPRSLTLVPVPMTACTMWRTVWPCGALTANGFVADFNVLSGNINVEELVQGNRYNVVVTPRFVFESPDDTDFFRAALHNKNVRWVYELDDDLLSPEAVHRQMTIYPGRQDIADKIDYKRLQAIRTIQLVDLITVASEPLADIVRSYTETPVVVVPNYLNVAAFQSNLDGTQRTIPPLTIGWSGGIRDDADLQPLINAWPVIAERYPQVHFVVAGYDCQPLLTCVPPDRITHIPGVEFRQYAATLLNIDIGCCVVDPHPWNEAKTAVKWVEMTMAGAACVVSEALYGRYVQHGQNALVAATHNQWLDHLSNLIERPELRQRLKTQAQQTVLEEHALDNHWTEWPLAWQLALAKDGSVH